MARKKKKNLHIPFALLLFASLPLVLFLIYFSFLNLSSLFEIPQAKQEKPISKLSDIVKPTYLLPVIQPDIDLIKLPTDYDSLVKTLKTSFTQHQKTTLLLYGESISKTKHTNITDAYKELAEKEIPILIPQEYINIYLENKFQEYKNTVGEINSEFKSSLNIQKASFSNSYQEYIFNQKLLQLPTKENTTQTSTEGFPAISNFLLETDSESINGAFYKLRVLKFLSKDLNTDDTLSLLNDIVIYSLDQNDFNTKNRLKKILKNVVYNQELNRDGNVYWKISIINGKSYVYPMYILNEYVVNNSNFNEPYDVEPLAQSRNSVRIPILMYHHINPMPNSDSRFVRGLYVTPEMFEEQLAYLVKKNYRSITSQELYDLLRVGKNPSQKSVMITFDDATRGQYLNAYPLLKKYGLTGVFYVPSSKTSITYNELREMARNGMIIESHSATHIDLVRENNQEKLYSEIVGSRYSLKSGTGQDVISISYPGCVADSDVYSYVAQAGYLIGGSCGKSIDHYFKSRLSLSRVHVFSSMDNLKNILSGKP